MSSTKSDLIFLLSIVIIWSECVGACLYSY